MLLIALELQRCPASPACSLSPEVCLGDRKSLLLHGNAASSNHPQASFVAHCHLAQLIPNRATRFSRSTPRIEYP